MSEDKVDAFLPKNRLEGLCDAIFAVTMTLMILDVKAPENIPTNLVTKELPDALLSLFPAIESYVVSFIILGTFWLRHQAQFKYLKSVDLTILIVNIFFLLLTGFVPFTVDLMKRYPDYDLPFMLYDINLIIMSLLLLFQWYYISVNDRIISENLLPDTKRKLLYFSIGPIIIFVVSFGVSFINARAAFLIIYLVPLFYLFYNMFYNKKIRTRSELKRKS